MALTSRLKKRYRELEARAAGRKVEARRRPMSRPSISPGIELKVLKRIDALESSRIQDPLVTVVIAAYNVADYLTDAVRSVLDQTLRRLEVIIVDDHSDDATLLVATELAETDSRVRVLRTPQNSGGPGVPRNIGIRESRAKYYTFLDGDDTLELHACKNLLEAAEETGADLTVGRTVRLSVSTGKVSQWYGALFTERRDNITAEDMPKLLDDSIAAGKLYRRSFTMDSNNWLLEGVHYEDLVFTARAYAEAQSITVIPTTVYRWHVYEADERKSITAQKDDVQNLIHRLNALNLVDTALVHVGSQILIDQMRQKFLRHDARVYLNISCQADDEWVISVCDAIEPRLRSYDQRDWDRLDSYARWVYGSVLTKNVAGVRQAILFSIDRGTLAGRAVRSGRKVYWQPTGTPELLPQPGSLEAGLLDLSDDVVLKTPRSGVKPRHEVKAIDIRGSDVEILGVTDDLGDWFTESTISIEIRLRKRSDVYSFPAQRIMQDDLHGITWKAQFTLPRSITEQRPQIWDVKVVMRTGESVNRGDISVAGGLLSTTGELSVPSLLGRSFGRSYRFSEVKQSKLALKLSRAEGKARFFDRATGAAFSLAKSSRTKIRRRVDAFSFDHLYSMFRKLPIVHEALFCESMLGKSAWDSPRYVAEQVLSLDPDITVYWTYIGSVPPELPRRFVPVRRWSSEYLYRAATSRLIVDNQTLPTFFKKRKEQRYLQTWHGTPLKLMGLDAPEFKYGPIANRHSLVERARQWDALVSPSRYFEDSFVRSYDYRGQLIKGGTPRNDILVSDSMRREYYKRKLNLPLDRPTVLYAPTFRVVTSTHTVKPGEAFRIPEWIAELGDQAYLLVRAHYLDCLNVPQASHPYALNAASVPNVNDLYLAADILITDYSSVMFDYALLDRPMIFFAYDAEDYRGVQRGTYFDITRHAPGPVVRDFESLLAAVRDVLNDQTNSSEKYDEFRDRFCGDEDGTASYRSAMYLLTGRDCPNDNYSESLEVKVEDSNDDN